MTTGTLNTSRTSAEPRRSTRAYEPAERVARPGRRGHETRTAPVRRPRRTGRLGSQQQVSVRGRRVSPVKKTNTSLVRWAVALTTVFVLGISAVMYLSGVTTEQSFQINDARQRSSELTNQLETLERDVAMAQSSANIAEKASEMGMVAPSQAGILDVQGDKVEERRASDPAATRPVVDVNGNQRPRGATSNPEETQNVPGLAPNSAVGAEAQNHNTGGLPYSPRNATPAAPADPAPARPAPAPAPGPAPASAPAPEANVPAPAPAPAAPAPAP